MLSAKCLSLCSCLNEVPFYVAGVGTAPSYTAVSTCLASLLDDVSFARVMTALTVGFDLMPLVLMVVYSQLFNGDAPGLEQDFSGYMLFLTILYFTIHSSFYIVFHFRKFGTRDVGPLPTKDGCKQLDVGSKDQSDEDETITECKEPLLQNDFEVQFMSAETVAKVENGSTNKCCEDDKIKEYYKSLLENDSEVNFTCKEAVKNARFLLGSLRFHLLIWPCAIGLALRILFCGNVHVYMESFRMETYSHTLQYIYPMTSVSLKLLLSAYVSIQGKHAAMLEVFILSALVNLAAIVWSLFPQDNAGAMAMLIALWSTFGSIASGLSVVLLKEEFGTVLFPLYTGAPLCTFALVSFLLQLSFGSFYDMYRQDEAVCYGPQCFLWTFLIAGLLAAASIAALAILMCRRRNAKECDTL